MAREAGLPVVPLATAACASSMRKGTWLFTPTKITIYVGAQIDDRRTR
jgi:1-acyl-sn-glycerol-3-phosphate acyltransferase